MFVHWAHVPGDAPLQPLLHDPVKHDPQLETAHEVAL
jgi:hypothetical protein